MQAIKIHNWQANNASELLPGEENAAVISFRIANVQGLAYFLNAFADIKKAIDQKENFSGCQFVLLLAKAAASIYKALKEAKAKA